MPSSVFMFMSMPMLFFVCVEVSTCKRKAEESVKMKFTSDLDFENDSQNIFKIYCFLFKFNDFYLYIYLLPHHFLLIALLRYIGTHTSILGILILIIHTIV